MFGNLFGVIYLFYKLKFLFEFRIKYLLTWFKDLLKKIYNLFLLTDFILIISNINIFIIFFFFLKN